MNWSTQCAVVVPCLNEGDHIASVVRGARSYLDRVIIVDDGSTDRTACLANRAGAKVVSHERPMGKGTALQAGFDVAFAEGFSWVLAMDGDGQHAVSDIPAFLADADRGFASMILGNRLDDPRGMPPLRRRVNEWMSRTLSEFCGVEIRDSQCGFRLIHLGSWKALHFSAPRFEVESELLVRFAAAGFTIRSVPVQSKYGGERSKIHPLRDTVRWLIWWHAIRRELGGSAPWPRAQFSHDPA